MLHRLQSTLHTQIPLTRALGVRVEACDPVCVTLSAPLTPNINHKATAFAGSLNALATLAGWSAIWCLLEEAGMHGKIVIQDSAIRFHRPVTGDFRARCCLSDADGVARFLEKLRRKGRARLAASAEIRAPDGIAVSFDGRYVIDLYSR